MPSYCVNWCIEIDAESSTEAAQIALTMQRDPTSTATVFRVESNDSTEMIDAGFSEYNSKGKA